MGIVQNIIKLPSCGFILHSLVRFGVTNCADNWDSIDVCDISFRKSYDW